MSRVLERLHLPYESFYGRVQVALDWLEKRGYCERTVIFDGRRREWYFYEATEEGRKVAAYL